MKSAVVSVLALMVLAGSALAAIPNTMDYKLATEPLITGTVASANDHMMVVNTAQGGKVTLAVDTKTMLPNDFGPGMAMRVEFRAMPDGHLYARRVTPIRGGMNGDRELWAREGAGRVLEGEWRRNRERPPRREPAADRQPAAAGPAARPRCARLGWRAGRVASSASRLIPPAS